MKRLLMLVAFAHALNASGQSIPDGCGFYLGDSYSTTLFALFGDDEISLLRNDLQDAVSNGKLGKLAVGDSCVFEYFSGQNFEGKIGQILGPSVTNLPMTPIQSLKCKCDHAIFASSADQVLNKRSKPNISRQSKKPDRQNPRVSKAAAACVGPACNFWPVPRRTCQLFTNTTPFSFGDDDRKYSWIFSLKEEESVPNFTEISTNYRKNLNDDVEAAIVSDGCVLRLYDGINFSNQIASIGGGRFQNLNRFQSNISSSAKCECSSFYSTSCGAGKVYNPDQDRCLDVSCISEGMYEGQKISQIKGRLTISYTCKNSQIIETNECPNGFTYAPCYGYCKPSIICAPGSFYDDCKVICERNPL